MSFAPPTDPNAWGDVLGASKAGGQLAWFVWSFARVWAILRLQVLWSRFVGGAWNVVSAAAALAVVFVLLPSTTLPASASSWPGWEALLLGVGFELLLGSVLGLLAALPQHAAIGAGLVSAEGLPLGRSEVSKSWMALWVALTLVFGFAMQAHHAALEVLAATFERWPAFSPASIWRGEGLGFVSGSAPLEAVVRATHAATVLALALSTPVLLTRAFFAIGLKSTVRAPKTASELDRVWHDWSIAVCSLVALGAAWSTFSSAWAQALV